MGQIAIGVDKTRSFRFYIGYLKDLIEDAAVYHKPSLLAATILGRTLVGAALMGAMLKGDKEKLTFIIRGEGVAKEVLATANGKGKVKGYIANPDIDLPNKVDGSMDLEGAIGLGNLTVIKDVGLKEPYTGSIGLVSGEVAEDLAAYFYISEQKNTMVALSESAGVIIQMMPEASEKAIEAVETLSKDLKPLKELMRESIDVSEFVANVFKGIGEEFQPIVLEERECIYECDCSKKRFEKALLATGKKSLDELADSKEDIETVCHFCGKKYYFTPEDIKKIRENAEDA